MTHPLILVLVFIVSAVVGYLIIKKVPSLLHTPLMSGMNALSGITVVGAIIVLSDAISMLQEPVPMLPQWLLYVAIILSGIAIILAMVNVAGGFGVTERMLRMFKKRKQGEGLSHE